MANTRRATLSMRLKPEIKKRLAKSAKASGRSSNFLISAAVEAYVADQERMLAETRQADRQVKSGHYFKQEDMKAWLLSWGTEQELPRNALAGKNMMTRRYACRDRLVAVGAGKVARGSCLRGAGQTRSCNTIGHKNDCGGGDFEVAPALRPRRSGAGYSRAGCRGNAVFDTLSSAGTARNYQYELARRAGMMSSGCAANGERPKSRPVPFGKRSA
jgi:predicted transcriptional regulator